MYARISLNIVDLKQLALQNDTRMLKGSNHFSKLKFE